MASRTSNGASILRQYSESAGNTEEELSLRSFPDDVLTSKMYLLHGPDDRRIDVDSFIAIFKTILARVNVVADSVFKGTENIEQYGNDSLIFASTSFDAPICLLHQISCEIGCKAPGVQNAHNTTMNILENLKSYTWEARAMLTLAAFALDYVQLWNLARLYPLDPLARLLGIVKGVPVLKNSLADSRAKQRTFDDLKSLIDNSLEVIKNMNEVKKNSSVREIHELSKIAGQIPLYTYWVIHAIAASKTEITSFTSEEHLGQQPKYMYDLALKIAFIRRQLEGILTSCRKHQDETDLYRWLGQHIEHISTQITLVFEKLIYDKNDRKVLIDGHTQTEVDINVLTGKDVLLVITGLHISDYKIDLLYQIHNEINKTDKYKIIWVPIKFYSTHPDPEKRFNEVRSKMPWYIVPFSAAIAGYKYIEEKWFIREDPLIVVMNPLAKIECANAFHLIQIWNQESIPFTRKHSEALLIKKNWFELTILRFIDHPQHKSWINQGRTIIFYGGKEDTLWLRQFEATANIFKNNAMLKKHEISFEIARVGKSSIGQTTQTETKTIDPLGNILWSLFIIKKEIEDPNGTQDILKLLFYKNETESNWAVLVKGSFPVVTCRGTIMLEAIENFELWKENVFRGQFADALKGYVIELTLIPRQCDTLTVPGTISGWIPPSIQCPECGDRFLDAGYSFKCCHGRDDI